VKVKNKSIQSENIDLSEINDIWCEIKFPDTVFKNSKYDGEIFFISQLDTVTTIFTDKEKDRYVIANVLITDNVNYDHKHLKKLAKDLYGAVDNRHIPLNDLIFSNTGDYFIDAIVNDGVYIDLGQKNIDGEELLRLLEVEVRVTKKVVVIDKE
jgi:hypothetical protein